MARVIVFSGVDGCGKSTLIVEVRRVLAARGLSTRCVWLRYNHYLIRPFHLWCRMSGLTRYEHVNGLRVGYRDLRRSPWAARTAIVLTYLDTLLASLVCVRLPALLARRVVICDRWVIDILTDLEVDTGIPLGPESWWGRRFLALVPRDALCVVVQRNAAEIARARPVHSVDRNYPKRRAIFDRWAGGPHATALNNDGPIAHAVREVIARWERTCA